MGRLVVVVAVGVVAFYGLAAVPEELIYDDELLVAKDVVPRGAGDLAAVFVEPHYGELPYYRPLVRLTYRLQKALHGNSPAAYRWVNAALAGLLLLAFYRLLRMPALGLDGAPALLAASWTVLHPIASSCVYPVAGRETLLPTLLILLTLLAWLRETPAWRLAAFCLFAAALLSKELAVVTPLLLLLADATLLRPRPATRAWFLRHAPSAVVLAAYFAIRGHVLDAAHAPSAGDPTGPLKSLAFGLQTLVAPYADLVYEPPAATWLSWGRLLPALALAAALAAAAWKLRPAIARQTLFLAAWFVAAQLPTANLLRQETPFDERYLLLATPAFAALIATVLAASPIAVRARRPLIAGALVWIALLAAVSHHRAGYFRSALIFHGQWARTHPGSANAHNGLGAALARAGRLDEAIEEYREAIRLRPEQELAHNNLGVALDQRGDHAGATRELEQALRIRPRYAEAHYNLANVLAAQDRLQDAAGHYVEALRLRPTHVGAHNNYAALLVRLGRVEDARRQLEEVMRLDPGHVRSRLNYGILLAREGRFAEALPYYLEALRIDPGSADAHYDIAVALENLQRPADALAHHRSALELARDSGNAALAAAIEQRLAALAGAGATSP